MARRLGVTRLQGPLLRQRELYERDAQWVKDNAVGVRDLRDQLFSSSLPFFVPGSYPNEAL